MQQRRLAQTKKTENNFFNKIQPSTAVFLDGCNGVANTDRELTTAEPILKCYDASCVCAKIILTSSELPQHKQVHAVSTHGVFEEIL